MQENRLLLWTKGKFKLIASSRMATCCHPTPEGMGIRAGHSIIFNKQYEINVLNKITH